MCLYLCEGTILLYVMDFGLSLLFLIKTIDVAANETLMRINTIAIGTHLFVTHSVFPSYC